MERHSTLQLLKDIATETLSEFFLAKVSNNGIRKMLDMFNGFTIFLEKLSTFIKSGFWGLIVGALVGVFFVYSTKKIFDKKWLYMMSFVFLGLCLSLAPQLHLLVFEPQPLDFIREDITKPSDLELLPSAICGKIMGYLIGFFTSFYYRSFYSRDYW